MGSVHRNGMPRVWNGLHSLGITAFPRSNELFLNRFLPFTPVNNCFSVGFNIACIGHSMRSMFFSAQTSVVRHVPYIK